MMGLMKQIGQVPPADLFLHQVFKIQTKGDNKIEIPDLNKQLSKFNTKKGKVGMVRKK